MTATTAALQIVNAGGTAVGELISSTLRETSGEEDTAIAGANASRFRPTRASCSGAVRAYFEPTDVGQLALGAGSVVALTFQPNGAGSGKPQDIVADALITSIDREMMTDAYIQVEFSYSGGAVDHTPQV